VLVSLREYIPSETNLSPTRLFMTKAEEDRNFWLRKAWYAIKNKRAPISEAWSAFGRAQDFAPVRPDQIEFLESAADEHMNLMLKFIPRKNAV